MRQKENREQWMVRMKMKNNLFEKRSAAPKRIVLICVFFLYLFTVLWYTAGRREIGCYQSHFDLFWSFRLWFDGETSHAYTILANIAMFVPFGFLGAAIFKHLRGKAILLIFLLSIAFSSLIETLQLTLMRGCFEFDDIVNNVAGALLGAVIYRLLTRCLPEKLLRGVLIGAGSGIVLFCLCLIGALDSAETSSVNPLSQELCFQVEEVSVEEDRLELTGVCFWYEQGPKDFTITLQSTQTGKRCPMRTQCGLSRPDVSAYFHQDDLAAGFSASCQGIQAGEEYEILLDFGLLRVLPTHVYLTMAQQESDTEARRVHIHYVPEAMFQPLESEGTDLEEIVNHGALRVYRPDFHIYVYWYENKLYWIAEEGFFFEQDGSTRLEMALHTTEPEKVPENVWRSDLQCVLFGVRFEDSELNGNFGRYRVCAKEMPKEYTITSVKTGYYAKKWVWADSFWPVFDFSR